MRVRSRASLHVVVLAAALAAAAPGPAGGQEAPTVEEPRGPVVVLAHRGASHDAPEHTLHAYDLAIAQDTDFLECDLQLTRDEVLVCVHDTDVTRTTGGAETGRVDSYTLAELRAMDFGSWFNTTNPDRARPEFAGARIVTFEEQLDCYRSANPRTRFHVETKAPAEYGGRVEPLLVDVLRRRDLVPATPVDVDVAPVIIQSFELESLEVVNRIAPTLPTAYLWAAPPPEVVDGSLPDGVDVAAPAAQALLADPTFVARAHAAGHDVHTYTVDDPATMDRLLDLGVDGIFTNRPDVLRARIDARGTGTRPADRGNPAGGPGCVAGLSAASATSAPPTRADAAPEAPAPGSPTASSPSATLPVTGPRRAPLLIVGVAVAVVGLLIRRATAHAGG